MSRYEELGWKYEDVEPRQAIRINTMNAEEASTIKRLHSLGIELEKISFLKNGYWICRSKFSLGAISEYLLGLYSIQEAAAQIPASLFTKLKDKKVLDACAAPGGKTVQLAELMQNTGVIIALDIKKHRLIALSNQLERCNVKNVIVYHLDARQVSRLGIKFDRILLDVPCSGNFVTDREWFSRRTLEDVQKNASLQREILAETVKVLKNDGEIVYATCSLEPEEDELNIDWAIKNLQLNVKKINCYGEKALTNIFGKQLDNTIENCRRIWPRETQGFFVCKLKKSANAL
ncbi:MAG TPA: RsmB/NOP family class I SAM-dependent RNA methyltransferase [Acidobacteriota bacterium]|nr:RsmB/NOP family class I SAM-dependent RNA methyltransferase [Acidobacteriota bacterium]